MCEKFHVFLFFKSVGGVFVFTSLCKKSNIVKGENLEEKFIVMAIIPVIFYSAISSVCEDFCKAGGSSYLCH